MRGIELEQLKYLTDCNTSAQMWSRLKTVHAEKGEQSAQVLLEKFINCKMEDDESIVNFIASVTSLAQRLKDMDLEQKEPMVIAKILSSLPTKFDHVRTAWYAVPRIEQNIERLTDHLVNEESLLNLRSNGVTEKNKTAYSVNKQNNSKHLNKRNGKCNYCHKQGHWARECFKRQRDQQSKSTNERNSLAITREPNTKDNEETSNSRSSHLFVLHSNDKQNKFENMFYADSGATDHMCFQRELYTNLMEYQYGTCQVKVGGGGKLNVVGDFDEKELW